MAKSNEINPNKDTILIGFKYDLATEIVFEWITDDEFLSSHPKENLFRYHDGSLDDQTKLTSQLKTHKKGVVEVFCGHGSDEALLGPSVNKSEKHYRFYHIGMISDLPGSLFAFSCDSGELFGWFYSCSGKNKTFLGFTKKIELPMQVISEVKNIFQKVATAIDKEGKITDNHEILFYGLVSKLIKDIEKKIIPCKSPLTTVSILENYKKCFIKH